MSFRLKRSKDSAFSCYSYFARNVAKPGDLMKDLPERWQFYRTKVGVLRKVVVSLDVLTAVFYRFFITIIILFF